MHFWCHHCEQLFESESNSEVYDQAICQQCDSGCLTFEAEYEDAKARAANDAVVRSMLHGVLGMLFSGFGLLGRAVDSRKVLPAILEYAAAIHYRRPSVAMFPSPDDAKTAQGLLAERAIECRIAETPEGYRLHVDEADVDFARRIISQSHEPNLWVNEQTSPRDVPLTDVFEAKKRAHVTSVKGSVEIQIVCEDCGKTTSFPAALDGTTQECRHCYAYVDVGELPWNDDFDDPKDSVET